jgi:hypothetical protein
MQRRLICPFFRRAFGWCVPIGGLAGLVGLGGAEFRLPVLMHGIGFETKSAVLLNLTVSLVTLPFAMISRSGAVSLVAVVRHLPEVPDSLSAVWRALFSMSAGPQTRSAAGSTDRFLARRYRRPALMGSRLSVPICVSGAR